MSDLHAKLSPSSAEKWMTCPAAIPFAEKFKFEDSESIFAQQGTAMHHVAERCLTEDTDAKGYIGTTQKGIIITEQFADWVQTYVDFVRGVPGYAVYEQRVRLERVPEVWGTADTVKIDRNHLNVIDAKFGMNRVEADENKQGLCYGTGAWDKFGEIFGVEKITFTIVQPPLNWIDSFTFDLARMEQHVEEIRTAQEEMKQARRDIEGMTVGEIPDFTDTWFRPSEKGCKWCPAKAYCPAQYKIANAAAKEDFATLTKSELADWGAKLPILKGFVKAVEDRMAKDLLNGKPVEGFKLVEGPRKRVWTDETTLVEELKKAFPRRKKLYMKPEELLSPAQLEKSLKNETFDLSPYIDREPGKPTVVPADDNRPEWDANASAKADFAGLKD